MSLSFFVRSFAVAAAMALLTAAPAQAQTAEELACQADVQGKVAWAQGGSTAWMQGNLERLCKGVTQRAKRIACFEAGILAHNNWDRAINDCATTGGGAATAIVAGRQCIFNAGGYELRVDWYNPGLIVFNGGDAKNYANYSTPATPYASEKIRLDQTSCTDAANRSAVVRIVGHDIANTAVTIATGTVTGVATGVLGAFACVGTAGAGCPAAVAGVAAATAGASSAAAAALPEVKEIAYIGVPGTKNYLDFTGTVWKVGIKQDVPLTQTSRNWAKESAEAVGAAIGDWITDGTPGPKSITFNNQAGYVAQMTVIYARNKDLGGVMVPIMEAKDSGYLSLGFSRHINVPGDIAPNLPVTVIINGAGTIKGEVFKITIPADFTGNRCFKSWGTIFDAQGGACN